VLADDAVEIDRLRQVGGVAELVGLERGLERGHLRLGALGPALGDRRDQRRLDR
jgi:hypothetical protein